MIRENEVSSLISGEIPALAIDLSLSNPKHELYKALTSLSNYTKDQIREHRSREVMQCFQTAYELLNDGSSLVRFAVTNIYVNSVSRLLECSFCPQQEVKAEFLSKFGTEYRQLIYSKNP